MKDAPTKLPDRWTTPEGATITHFNKLSNYPMIKREADETNRTPIEISQLIVETAYFWIDLAAEIEALRCGGKKKCREAVDVAEVIQHRDAAISALELI